ncbi:oxygenase MpaB family protein [Aggregatilineales bacterium SYSU G02658]
MSRRYDVLARVLALDPQRDCQEIVRLVGAYESPWLMQKSLEFALFRTYAVPSISGLLAQTGRFQHAGQRRYDDTTLLISEFVEEGLDSPRGRAALRQMNRLHGRFAISNEDYLYVLSTFIYTPIYWHRRFGWRPPTHHENLANYYFWCEVGRRMNIKDIPPTFEAFEAFHQAYEREHFVYADTNRQIAEYTIQVFCSWYPRFLTPLIRQVIYTFLDEPLRRAFGYPDPNPALKLLTHGALKLRGFALRYLPPRQAPYSLRAQPTRSYPHGYEIEQLGVDA